MSDLPRPRPDPFNVEMAKGATFVGDFEFPLLERSSHVPLDLISFLKRGRANEAQWIHFYVDDHRFFCVWRKPRRYLKALRRAAGAITPDFTISLDMPLWMQIKSVGMNRTIGHWLQSNGVKIIPNVRWGDSRSYSFAFDGIAKGGTVAVGSHGCIKDPQIRPYFLHGFDKMIERTQPKAIVVYGALLREMAESARQGGARIIQFPCERETARRKNGGKAWD